MEVALVTLQPENLGAELVQNFGAGGEEEKLQNKQLHGLSFIFLTAV